MLNTDMYINREVMTAGQAHLAELLGIRRPGMTDLQAADAARIYVLTFLRSLGVPTTLREVGVRKEDFPELAHLDATEPAFGQGLNRVTDEKELMEILEMAW